MAPIPTRKARTPRGATLAASAVVLGLALGACAPRAEIRTPDQTVRMQVGLPAERLPARLRQGVEADGPPLRVLLRRQAQGLKVSAGGGLRLRDPDSGRVLAELPPQGRGRLGATGSSLSYNGRPLGLPLALIEPLKPGEPLKAAGRRYRGTLALQAVQGELMLLNIVGLEGYLKGVLPAEMPADWPLEALKAQAVAARSFALVQAAKAKPHWDLDDSTASQVYRGLDAERPGPSRAVDETRGVVLSHLGKVAEAFFHSNSGGHTADVSEVWGGQLAYLRGVLDTHSEDQKHYAWTAVIPLEQAEQALAKAGLWQGVLDDLVGRDLSESGRWLNVELLGAAGERKRVKATELRRVLGADRLRSTRFRVRRRGADLVFDGLGWGHGVGLSQEGAKVQAEQGWDHRRILRHYYPGTRLARLKAP